MKVYPESAALQLEFDKVKALIKQYCRTGYATHKTDHLRIHTRKDIIEQQLRQTHEFKLLLDHNQYFPNEFFLNVEKEIKLLGIPGGMLTGEQFIQIRKLTESIRNIFRWFDPERKIAYPGLFTVMGGCHIESNIITLIDQVLDEYGNVKDQATPELEKIRMNLFRKRSELRRIFEKVVAKLARAGYAADIAESFSNGRRVVAVFSEHKRQVKGILHGESDSRKTSFIEPEETIELNNLVFSLENEERKEVVKILRNLTARLSVYSPLLQQYYIISGEFDFIAAKSRLAVDLNASFPNIADGAILDLKDAYHPLLFLYNKNSSKKTIPVTVTLQESNRILVISGPNAGGKTVTMKTIGLNQLMLQSGLLVPVHPSSQMGIFRQLFIHMGDTQNLEFELSTYSSHLLHMKFFIENANGKTLFFIDELGSGSDPSLGGAFAEVILEELARRHALGIVTTHYLNLKVMANRTSGIVNGAMAFDEANLKPLYQLTVGKPGSSYTFSIAERIGLPQPLINRARKLVEEDHFRLDKLLNRTEQDLQKLQEEKKELAILLKENEKLKREMELVISREKHSQQVELLRQQNKLTAEKLTYLKETERKIRQVMLEWKKTENKEELIKQLQQLFFKKKEHSQNNKLAKKVESRYMEVSGKIIVGAKVKMKKNYQVGTVREVRGKRAIVQIGLLPMNVEIADLVVVQEKVIS